MPRIIQPRLCTQATREVKDCLEKAVISAGRQMKLLMTQRDSLIHQMKDRIAHETAEKLETVYGPLLEAYRSKCARLEEQINPAQSAQAGPAQHGLAPLPHHAPQQRKQAPRVRLKTCLQLAAYVKPQRTSCMRVAGNCAHPVQFREARKGHSLLHKHAELWASQHAAYLTANIRGRLPYEP